MIGKTVGGPADGLTVSLKEAGEYTCIWDDSYSFYHVYGPQVAGEHVVRYLRDVSVENVGLYWCGVEK